jgi:hypothetical protein
MNAIAYSILASKFVDDKTNICNTLPDCCRILMNGKAPSGLAGMISLTRFSP